MNHFTIIITACQEETWIGRCIESCVTQNFTNFDVLLLDACSTDKTFDIAKEYEREYSNLKAIRSNAREPQVANISALTIMAKDHTIIVSVDGDDCLKNDGVLNVLDETYSEGDVWLTYGSHEMTSNGQRPDWTFEYPRSVVESGSYRKHDWLATHLRTYRKELFLQIDENDLKRDGDWMNTTGDQAMMLPMLEMAGKRHRYIHDILYVYNDLNAHSDSNTNIKKQREMADYIRIKNRYLPLANLP